jgi:NAD(P)-dependent dehydrogenase (short-subunit alcohol dehydrogenase family)
MAAAPGRVLIAGIGGVGRALALRLAARGAPVHLVARSADKLAALRAELAAAAAPGTPAPTSSVADLTLDADVERAAREAAGAAGGGPLAGLVYAVGSIPLKPLKGATSRDFAEAFALNCIGGAMLLRACLPQLLLAAPPGAAPASAVFFSTVASRVGFPNHTAIAAAKGGVEAFVRSAAAELAPRLRVNCVAPSLSDTPLAARMTSNEAVKKALGEAHPLPRIGTADDSAAMADFLLDDSRSSWISGQIFSVDGGRSVLRPKN